MRRRRRRLGAWWEETEDESPAETPAESVDRLEVELRRGGLEGRRDRRERLAEAKQLKITLEAPDLRPLVRSVLDGLAAEASWARRGLLNQLPNRRRR